MQVRETTLEELLGGVKQFRVPLFQRPYTWDEENHAQLWRDILAVYESATDQETGTELEDVPSHFLGSFVLAPHTGSASGLTTFLVVDGQQRLTTLLLALCALRDVLAITDLDSRERVSETYLVNRWQKGQSRHKLLPAKQDRESYFAAVDDRPDKGSPDAVGSAYRFFVARLADSHEGNGMIDLGILERVIVSKLTIIDITAQPGDNVHRIFESLNATGVSLTQADLLRNYLMMLLPNRADTVYSEIWYPMQRSLGSQNLEALARVDLQRRGLQVRADDVYRMQQRRLRPFENDEARIEAEIRDLALRAVHYGAILDPTKERNPQVRARLEFLNRWGAQTAHPLIMYLYELRENDGLSDEDLDKALWHLESFLVRRLLTGASRKNLNRIFPQLVRRLQARAAEPNTPEVLREELSGERLYWASDDSLVAAMRSEPFYFYGRSSQRRLVLERLEESYGHKEQAQLTTLPLSIEHIMPQTLTDEWRTAILASGDSPDVVHMELKHTIGNLTLTGYNSELSNKPFERKQQIYEDSHLSLNKDLVGDASWGRSEILARSTELAKRSIEIWGPPAEVASAHRSGPAWGRLHSAMAAIPPGNWTSYGDLAELLGTSAQAVGTHIGSNLALLGSHRVLTSNGSVAEGFRWLDPADDRDPMQVLGDEGLQFSADGRADPEARLDSEELAGIAGILEERLVDDSPEADLEWDDALITRCYLESPPPMQAFMMHMATNPDRTFTSKQMASAIDRTGQQLAGVLGAFGRRVKNRYSMRSWPFDAQWSDDAGHMFYRMPADVSAVVIAAAEHQSHDEQPSES